MKEKYMSLTDAAYVMEIPPTRLVNLILTGQVNGCVVWAPTCQGSISEDEVLEVMIGH